jgi:hypothetical protein
MHPAMVWLNLVPVVAFVWGFVTVRCVSESLDREFRERYPELGGGDDYGKILGYAAMACLGILSMIPGFGSLIFLGGLVLWLIYWLKIAAYSRQLNQQWW